MIQFDAEDFFDTDDFAEAVLLGDGRQVLGIFDEAFTAQAGGLIEGQAPQLTLPEQTAEGVRIDDRITVRSQDFRVIGREPDGAGLVVLRLRRAV